jgi:hypothetical protein
VVVFLLDGDDGWDGSRQTVGTKVWKDCGHGRNLDWLVGGLVDEGSLKRRLRHILTAFAMCDYTNVLLYLFLRMADPEILPMLDVRVGSTMDVRVDMAETPD